METSGLPVSMPVLEPGTGAAPSEEVRDDEALLSSLVSRADADSACLCCLDFDDSDLNLDDDVDESDDEMSSVLLLLSVPDATDDDDPAELPPSSSCCCRRRRFLCGNR